MIMFSLVVDIEINDWSRYFVNMKIDLIFIQYPAATSNCTVNPTKGSPTCIIVSYSSLPPVRETKPNNAIQE